MNQHHTMPHISVESPVTHNSWEDGKYTTYDIVINCEEDSCPLFALPRSTVSRRYREFRWLRKRLGSVSAPIVRRVPPLPTVGCPLFDDRFSPDFIENRRRGLEEFLQGVCAIPTLLSVAALHLFVQTDLSLAEIDAYVDRKWGRQEEVYDVIVSLNQQKQTEERDEIASIASVGRWSEASLLDLEDDSASNVSTTSSANNTSTSSAKKSQPRAVVSQKQVLVADAEVLSPVLGLYLPPEEIEEPDSTAPVIIRAPRGQERVAQSAPIGVESRPYRRSRSVQIHDSASMSSSSSFSPGSYQNTRHLSSSLSPNQASADDDVIRSPTSVDIYNRRRRGKSPGAVLSPKNLPYYCSNAVWLSSAVGTGGANSRSRSSVSGGSQATSSLSPPSSSSPASSSLSNARRP